MTTYNYVAYEESGRRTKGVVEALDVDAAVATLAAKGVHILDIKESNASVVVTTPGKSPSVGARPVSRADLALFTRRLADLASAGFPLDRALGVAGEHSDNATLGVVTQEAVRDVHAGLPISEALAKHPKLFPPVFTMTLRAGEASGQFPAVARRLADFQQIEIRRRSQLTAALVYPAILSVTAIMVVSIMMLFVVPRLSGVFKGLGDDLPMSTRLLLSSSGFIMDHWIGILVSIGGAIALYKAWVATEPGALVRDRWLLHMPIAGKVISKAVVSRYARVLGTLVFGGVPILESLRIAGAAAGNRVFEKSSQKVQEDVREGRRLAESMKETGAFSSIMVQMVSVGEEIGDLPSMLNRVSETLDFEVDNGMTKLMTFVEPIIVLVMGTFVGFVVLSILIPVYQAQELVK
ncbi:type II secretion system F family protein [Fimbriimonas ginsengisoli]|uniref:Type II secretion system protein n=1 Tax=Fimbriimonas ginsengisoli Gsoil 348 TaxID=661478 RepID=A0A068NRI4_FIMGI|nr:type II secretion system F family protein [Fimbriimonas ginsengisoli]AIE85982.1 type II secretion system protein [Fimbriimonas ginsengisoli Gsoil 348]